MIYLDNNATTMMGPETKRVLVQWCNKGNPSAGYAAATAARAAMMDFRRAIGAAAGVSVCCQEDRDGGVGAAGVTTYKVIFTSGGSEANAAIINHFCGGAHRKHVIASAVEHKSVLDHLGAAEKRDQIMLSLVAPRADGRVYVDDIRAQLRPDTVLICVMHANNETGAVNDIAAIGALANSVGAHFHCDTVQTFGKLPFSARDVDSFSISFHKLHGPPGIGALVTRLPIEPLVYGSQNEHLRGGTENLPGIMAAAAAFSRTNCGRAAKNRRQRVLKQYMLNALGRMIAVISYQRYIAAPLFTDCIVVFSDASELFLPGTLLLSVVSRRAKVCNAKIKRALEQRGIIVSVGSACNTASDTASHVVVAMGADEYVRRGVLRISLSDETTFEETKKFITEFAKICDSALRNHA